MLLVVLRCWLWPASGRQPTEDRRDARHSQWRPRRPRAGRRPGGNSAGLPRSLGEAVPVLRLSYWRARDLGRRIAAIPDEQHDAASDGDGPRPRARRRRNGLAQTLSRFFFLGKVSESLLLPFPPPLCAGVPLRSTAANAAAIPAPRTTRERRQRDCVESLFLFFPWGKASPLTPPSCWTGVSAGPCRAVARAVARLPARRGGVG